MILSQQNQTHNGENDQGDVGHSFFVNVNVGGDGATSGTVPDFAKGHAVNVKVLVNRTISFPWLFVCLLQGEIFALHNTRVTLLTLSHKALKGPPPKKNLIEAMTTFRFQALQKLSAM